MLILALVVVSLGGGGYIIYNRRGRIGVWVMEQFVKELVGRVIAYGFNDAVDLVATAVVPYLRAALTIPEAGAEPALIDVPTLRMVIAGAAAILGGGTPEAQATAVYTVEQVANMQAQTASLATSVLASYALPVPAADQARLLGAVAEQVLVQVSAV